MSIFCDLDAYYWGRLVTRFYSLDEAGHVQVRAPMTYLTQIADWACSIVCVSVILFERIDA